MMDNISCNIDSINISIVSKIQSDLELNDVKSLVFLLYEVPYTALQRLSLLQQASRKDFDLLGDWAKQAQSRESWKYEFLEALSICQLYSVIKKMGFNVETVKLHFLPNNIHVNIYIDPMRKVLYKLCENMTSDYFIKFKSALITYNIDVKEFDTCEMVLLELMCNKFIKLKSGSSIICKVENLIKIIGNISGLQEISADIKVTQDRINGLVETSNEDISNTSKTQLQKDQVQEINNKSAPEESLNVISKFNTSSVWTKEIYQIFNKDKIGVCYIVNQERFYPSKQSIELCFEKLEDRRGSQQDVNQLKKTMEHFNFNVITDTDLKYDEIPKRLKHVLKYNVQDHDSVFILCILSHGIEGCIYSADSIPLKVREIQNILDSNDAAKLIGKPKVFIIQACQSTPEPPNQLVTDAPVLKKHIGKTDFLIYWATVPEYLAYRDEKKGSVFIQMLCWKIDELGDKEHLEDIFKRVNYYVINFCEQNDCKQVPLCESTLRKKLYLAMPELITK